MKRQVYTIGIVDDQLEELAMIIRYLDRLSFISIVFKESSPVHALAMIEEKMPDILLLDLEMPTMNALQLYQSLDHQPVLMICSGHKDYAYEASALRAIAYFPKWLPFEQFERYMLRAIEEVDRTLPSYPMEESITVPSIHGGGYKTTITIADIIYIEVQDKETTFYCTDFPRKGKITLEKLEKLLPNEYFIRVHRSFMVNTQWVESNPQSMIYMYSIANPVPIGKAYTTSTISRLRNKV